MPPFVKMLSLNLGNCAYLWKILATPMNLLYHLL